MFVDLTYKKVGTVLCALSGKNGDGGFLLKQLDY